MKSREKSIYGVNGNYANCTLLLAKRSVDNTTQFNLTMLLHIQEYIQTFYVKD